MQKLAASVLVAVALLGACGPTQEPEPAFTYTPPPKPKAGDGCGFNTLDAGNSAEGSGLCDSTSSGALICEGGTLIAYPCRAEGGCTMNSNVFHCIQDHSLP